MDCYKAIETISVRDFYVGLFFLVFLSHFASKLQSWTKVLTHLSKTNAFYRRPSVTWKSTFFVDSQPPSPPFQCCNTLRGHFHLVTTLKRGEGVEMPKLEIENSLVERNGSFSESVSTTFVHDCSLKEVSNKLLTTRFCSKLSSGKYFTQTRECFEGL